MNGDRKKDKFQAFTKGKEYKARKGTVKGLFNEPFGVFPVLRARNDKGESHIIKHLARNDLNDFFSNHFKEL